MVQSQDPDLGSTVRWHDVAVAVNRGEVLVSQCDQSLVLQCFQCLTYGTFA